jgi:hypothetical protein
MCALDPSIVREQRFLQVHCIIERRPQRALAGLAAPCVFQQARPSVFQEASLRWRDQAQRKSAPATMRRPPAYCSRPQLAILRASRTLQNTRLPVVTLPHTLPQTSLLPIAPEQFGPEPRGAAVRSRLMIAQSQYP